MSWGDLAFRWVLWGLLVLGLSVLISVAGRLPAPSRLSLHLPCLLYHWPGTAPASTEPQVAAGPSLLSLQLWRQPARMLNDSSPRSSGVNCLLITVSYLALPGGPGEASQAISQGCGRELMSSRQGQRHVWAGRMAVREWHPGHPGSQVGGVSTQHGRSLGSWS